MAVELNFSINVYGLTDSGKKVKIAQIREPGLAEAVGGTIFYIDDTADGVYEFFDADGNLLQNVQVGDKPYAYRIVTPGTKDKYYVYHDELYSKMRWAPYKNGEYAEESLGTSYNIGSGKTNTEIVMTKDGGAYITADSNGFPTIWYQLQQTRLAKAGGCDDWFIPSRDEVEELRKSIGFQEITTSDEPVILPAGKVTGGVIAGTADGQAHYIITSSKIVCYPSDTKFLDEGTWRDDKGIWCSSESSSSGKTFWYPRYQSWTVSGLGGLWYVFFVRAF